MFGFESGKPAFPNKHFNHREQVEPLISLYQDGEATPEEQRVVEFYLERCPECRVLFSAFRQVETDLGEFLHATPVPRLDSGFYRQTPFYQAAQRKSALEVEPRGDTRPFVNAVSPVISGGNSGSHRRTSFASSFGGLAAALALLIAVGALLFFSINTLNNNPVPTVDSVAYSKPSLSAATSSPTTAPATTAPATSTSAATTTRVASTPTPKNSGGGKTTSSTTTVRNQGVSTRTTPPPVNTTTKAAGNVTTVANAGTTSSLNTAIAATTQPKSSGTTAAATTSATTVATTTQQAITTNTATTAPAGTATPAVATTENPTVTPSFPTPPLDSGNATATVSGTVSTVSGSPAITPTVTPSFTLPATASDTVSSTAITVGQTTTAAATTTVTTAPVLTATTVPPTTAAAIVSVPGWIAYVSTKDGEVHLINSDGTNDHALTHGSAASVTWKQLVWSPDARWLAAVGQNRSSGVYSIYTLDSISSHPDTEPAVDGFAPSWSPNSRLLSYLADAKLDTNGVRVGKSAVLDLKHRVTTYLDNTYTGFGPQWFPDGQRLLAGQTSIYQIAPSATSQTFAVTLLQNVKLAFTNTCLATSLSPDGTRLANLEIATNGEMLPVYYDLTRSGTPRIPLTLVPGLNNTIRAGHNCGTLRLSWTPTGHSLYFYAQSGNIYYNVLESISTGDVNYLTNIYEPSFTQDGQYLVDFDPTTTQVYAMLSSTTSRSSNSPVIATAKFAPSWQPVYK